MKHIDKKDSHRASYHPLKRVGGALLLLLLISLLGTALYFHDRLWLLPKYFESGEKSPVEIEKERDPQFSPVDLETRALEAYQYAKAHDFDLEHAILIDYGRHSGKNRFFVWNFIEKRIEIESLVAHGYGNSGFESSNQEIVFSNTPNSYASSLGKYRIGARAPSKWGINIHYKMHGLEATNDRAFERYIVLHSFEMIPEEEPYPAYLPMGFSQGCPVIDNGTMVKVDQLLQQKSKPVLLWAYYLE